MIQVLLLPRVLDAVKAEEVAKGVKKEQDYQGQVLGVVSDRTGLRYVPQRGQ